MKGPRRARMPVYGPGSKRLGRTEKETEWLRFHALQFPGNSHCAPTSDEGNCPSASPQDGGAPTGVNLLRCWAPLFNPCAGRPGGGPLDSRNADRRPLAGQDRPRVVRDVVDDRGVCGELAVGRGRRDGDPAEVERRRSEERRDPCELRHAERRKVDIPAAELRERLSKDALR
jgi:hypothetical protein